MTREERIKISKEIEAIYRKHDVSGEFVFIEKEFDCISRIICQPWTGMKNGDGHITMANKVLDGDLVMFIHVMLNHLNNRVELLNQIFEDIKSAGLDVDGIRKGIKTSETTKLSSQVHKSHLN